VSRVAGAKTAKAFIGQVKNSSERETPSSIEMSMVIFCFLVVAGMIYYFRFSPRGPIEPFVDQRADAQTVGDLIQDRDNLFKFVSGRFVYLDQFIKRIKGSLKKNQKEREKIDKFMKQHSKNVLFLKKMNSNTKLIKPVYTKRDLKRSADSERKIKKFYQHHLKQFLGLHALNTQLLVQELYCQGEITKCPAFSKKFANSMSVYKESKKKFNDDYGAFLGEF
jgi:hypothetical protein